MLRFVARHGLVRLIGGRAVPALLLWDLAMMANRARRIPVVERGLRRGVDAAGRRVAAAAPVVRTRAGRQSPAEPAARPGRPPRPGRGRGA